MNLHSRVEKLAWAIHKSRTLQSVHFSNNEIPYNIQQTVLMVFGIRTSREQASSFTAHKKTQSYHARRVPE